MTAAFAGEELLAIDEMPGEADAADAVEVIEDVRSESIAAIMQEAPARYASPRRWNPDYAPRPFSGFVGDQRAGTVPKGWS